VTGKWTDFLRGKFPAEFAKQTGGTGGDAAATEQAAASCPAPPPGATTSSSGDAAVVYGGAATVDGRPYTVDVTEDDAGNRTMTVRDPDADCHVVDERDL
jgi:hypothetical protein